MTRKHYVPALTVRRADGAEQAVCGTFVHDEDRLHVNQETDCWGCRLWLHEVEYPTQRAEERARVLARITEQAPYGEPMEAA